MGDDITFEVEFCDESKNVDYNAVYLDFLRTSLTLNGEEYTLNRHSSPDGLTSPDYITVTHGLGITEYTFDGVLWKVVTDK